MARSAKTLSGSRSKAPPPVADDPWDLLPVGFWKFSPQGTLLLANRSCRELLGYEPREMIGRPVDDFLADSVNFELLQHRTALLGKVSSLEAWIRHKDGTLRPVFLDVSRDTEKAADFHCVLTANPSAKRAPSDSRNRLELLLRNEVAIIIQNLEGQVVYWNMGAERLHGLPPHEVLGRPLPRELGLNPLQLQNARQATLERGEWNGEFRCTTAGGTDFEVATRWVLLRDQLEKPQAILLINEDAAESRLLEEERLRAQRQECIGTLAGGIAHDLNNILQPISIALDLLRARLADGDSEELLGMVDSNIRRATELVRQILTFTSGTQTERQPVEVGALFDDVSNFIHQAFPKTIRFQMALHGKTSPILADRTQMEQVLLNLCVNARDAMQEGGALRLEATDFPVDSQFAARQPLAQPGRYVRLTVSDTGRGIPRQIRKKIFEPFFTTKGPEKGTGLGLATALGIIRSHNGFLTLETEEGRGSSFHVFIPAVLSPDLASKSNASPEAKVELPGHGESLLLVDDESTVLKVMQRSLEKSGYRVLTARDGEEGLETFLHHSDTIRLVITDMAMPRMDGLQLVEEIRRTGSRVPILCTSGLSTAPPDLPASRGIRQILPKPCSSQAILRAIREALHETDR
jgi:two-component system cell cycle sensor histidine kinase/response regulator CckA